MSEQTTTATGPVPPVEYPVAQAPALGDHYIEIPGTLVCKVPGCGFETTSSGGMKRHNTRQHVNKKPNKPKKPVKKQVLLTQASKKERESLTKVWVDKSGTQILCRDSQGDWWVAEKLVV